MVNVIYLTYSIPTGVKKFIDTVLLVCNRTRSESILILRFGKYLIGKWKVHECWTKVTKIIFNNAWSKTSNTLFHTLSRDIGKISSQGENLVALVITGRNNLNCKDDFELITWEFITPNKYTPKSLAIMTF